MQKLRRWAAAALCGAAFAGSAAAVLAACAVCPGRAWIVRGALFLQDPAAAAAIAWPADAARAAYKPQKPDRRPTPVPTATPSPAPTAAATPTPEPSPASTPLPSAAPELDDAGRIRSVTLRQGSGDGYVALAAGNIRNSTEHTDADLRAAVTTQNLPFAVEKNSAPPAGAHHAHPCHRELPDLAGPVFDPSYGPQQHALNMCAVGEKMAQVLNAAGIRTLHDETLYDAPGYTDSYKRSRAGVQAYLERYPSIKVVLDVHRDAIEDSDGTQVKPVCEIDGESINGAGHGHCRCGNGSSIALPNWRLNLRFAAEWEAAMESAYPGLDPPRAVRVSVLQSGFNDRQSFNRDRRPREHAGRGPPRRRVRRRGVSRGAGRKSHRQHRIFRLTASTLRRLRHGICVAEMLDNTSIICAFGLAAAALARRIGT